LVVGLNYFVIVVVYDSGEEFVVEGGVFVFYIVMEYVEGWMLCELVSLGCLMFWCEVLNVMFGVLVVLVYSYCIGIVYCDIKFVNVMVMFIGDMKVMDFGIVCVIVDFLVMMI